MVIGSDCFFDFMVLTKDGEAGFRSSSLWHRADIAGPRTVAVVGKDDDLPACKLILQELNDPAAMIAVEAHHHVFEDRRLT